MAKKQPSLKKKALPEAIAKSRDTRWLVLGVATSALAAISVPGLAFADIGGQSCGSPYSAMNCTYTDDIDEGSNKAGISARRTVLVVDLPGSITLNAQNITTTGSGSRALGIDASTLDGTIDITADTINSSRTGVRAKVNGVPFTNSGNIDIEVGDIASSNGGGVETHTSTGTTTIKTGNINAEGGKGISASAASNTPISLSTAGSIISNPENITGVISQALGSPAITVETGNINSQGTGVETIVSGGGVGSLTVPGLGGIDIQAGNVSSDSGDGIHAETGFGTVAVKAGNVTAGKDGVHAESGFALGFLPDVTDLSNLDLSNLDLGALLAAGVSVDVGDVNAAETGIRALSSGLTVPGLNITVPGVGNVAVQAGDVQAGDDGITAGTGLGLVTVNAGNVNAENGDGISAKTGAGLAAITAGNVNADGQGVHAVVDGSNLGGLNDLTGLLGGAIPGVDLLENGLGVAYANVGDVTSTSAGGVEASTGLGAAVALAGNVDSLSTGVRAHADTGVAFAMANDVTTGSTHANGIDVSAGGLAGAVATGKVTTTGNHSAGVSVSAQNMGGLTDVIDGIGNLVGTNDLGGLIDQGLDTVISGIGLGQNVLPAGTGETIAGLAGDALDAVSGGVAVGIVNEVETSGNRSAGLQVEAPEGIAGAMAFGPVTTSGNRSAGITASGENFAGVVALGPVTTSGNRSAGIEATATDGSAYVIAGNVSTSGNRSAGIINSADGSSVTVFGSVSTTGNNSPAVVATDPGSDVLVAGGVATTTGNNSGGISATSVAGDVDVYVGAVGTAGSNSTGIRAASVDGAVNVAAGAVGTEGDNSTGIRAFSRNDSVNVDAGAVGTAGNNAGGIRAVALGGNVDINAVYVGTAGNNSTGVSGFSHDGSVNIDARRVGTVGDNAVGISANALAGDVNINTRSVGTIGDNSTGIAASSDNGSVSVNALYVGTAGNNSAGVHAEAPNGDVDVTTGMVGTLGDSADGIYANSVDGSVSIQANGPLTAVGSDSRGIYAMSANGATQVNVESFVLGGSGNGAGVEFGGGDSALLTNNGWISSLNGMAIVNDDNDSVVQNNGTVVGHVSMGGGNDHFYNNAGARFVAAGDSDFGAGNNDLFVNAGTLTMGDWRTSPETVTFTGLETFDNSPGGTIQLTNGIAGDTFHFTNSDLVRGGTFAFDAELRPGGTGDELYFGGSVTGTTGSQVDLLVNDLDNNPGQYDPNGVRFATVAGNTNVGDFSTNGGIDKGLFRYDAYLKPNGGTLGEDEWYLASTLGRSAYELPVIASAAQDLWHDSAATWRERTSDLRLDHNATAASGEKAKTGAWVKLFGGNIERRFENTSSAPSGMVGPSHTYSDKVSRRHQGVMLGVDHDFRASGPNAEQSLLGGVMAGYTDSRLKFSNSSTRANYHATSLGVYATWLDGGLFVDGAFKADFGRVSYRGDLGNFRSKFRSLGATLDAGYRYSPSNTWFIEPKATLAYVHTRYDDGKLAGAKVNLRNGDSVRGRLGARVGTQFDTTGNTIEPWLELSLWHEFKKHPSVSLSGSGWDVPVRYNRGGSYGTAGLGVDIFNKGNGWSGFAKATTTFGKHSLKGFSGTVGIRKAW